VHGRHPELVASHPGGGIGATEGQVDARRQLVTGRHWCSPDATESRAAEATGPGLRWGATFAEFWIYWIGQNGRIARFLHLPNIGR